MLTGAAGFVSLFGALGRGFRQLGLAAVGSTLFDILGSGTAFARQLTRGRKTRRLQVVSVYRWVAMRLVWT